MGHMPTKRPPASPLLARVRTTLRKEADAANAKQMQAYMKSTIPYHGVKLPRVRQIAKQAFAEVTFSSRAEWEEAVRALWHGATHREERYAALVLLGHRAGKPFRDAHALPLYEELIVDGAWWDLVDDVAVHFVGPLLDAADPKERKLVAKTMRAWSRSDDLWKRRTSIICQVLRKETIDLELLEACVAPSLDRREFFLRKAIGWALRSVAWKDAAWVERYVKTHDAALSPLSKREALKNI
jgi:3-methyladenine DNA glycosylase AlkD